MLKREPEDKSKKDKKTLHTNRVSLSEEDLVENEIRATVADLEIPLLLDTGAQITILPEEIVPTTAKIGEKVHVKGYVGCAKLREMARVKIKAEDMTWFETVALAPSSELNGRCRRMRKQS